LAIERKGSNSLLLVTVTVVVVVNGDEGCVSNRVAA